MSTALSFMAVAAKRILLVSSLAIMPLFLQAQDAPAKTANLRLVNAVGGEGGLTFTLDKKELNADGYTAGNTSGWLGLKKGSYKLRATHSVLGSMTLPLKLKVGDVRALVFYAKTVPSKKEGDPPKVVLASYTMQPPVLETPGKKPAKSETEPEVKPKKAPRLLKYVSVLSPAKDLELTAGKDTLTLAALKPFISQIPTRGIPVLPLKMGEKTIGDVQLVDPRNRMIVVYPTAPEGEEFGIIVFTPP